MENEETQDVALNNDILEVDLEEEDDSSDELAQIKAEKERLERELGSLKRDFKKLTKAPLQKPNEDLDGIKSVVSKLQLAEQKRQFGYENHLSPEEADYIFKVNPKPSKELLEDPFIKGGLEAIRAAKRVADNTPSTSSRSPRFEIPKKDDLTSDDKQKAFEDYLKEKFNK